MLDVRMLCLAALMGRPASGYDIKKELERGSATGLIDASFGSIYPALARLADEGHVAVSSEGAGARDRKVYEMTPDGRAYFLKTLASPLPDEKYRSPFLFAMLFADELPRSRVTMMIDQQITLWEQKIAAIDALTLGRSTCAGQAFANGIGVATLRAGLDYLRRHRASVEKAAQPDPRPVGAHMSQTSSPEAAAPAAE
ncbi:MAG: PadR family transcriptional regulator [Micropepsaceae bacterium]